MAKDTENIPDRKKDHIELASLSQTYVNQLDTRFYYEPLLCPHPLEGQNHLTAFGSKTLSNPIWVSSMTGGTHNAKTINENLARVCKEFGLGLGLGSCRKLIDRPETLPDFNVRDVIGADLPFYANLGVAQIEQWFESGQQEKIKKIVDVLKADGLIIHINPLQEYMQTEGDRFKQIPLNTIKKVLDYFTFPLIVKEVGQGMGPASLKALLELPLQAIEFGAFGGTNFSFLEMQRQKNNDIQDLMPLIAVGHTAEEMVNYCNVIAGETKINCKQLIISGGVRNFLDGYYLIQKSKIPAVYGQASGFLKYAMGNYKDLRAYVKIQLQGLNLAYSYLKIKDKT